MVTSSLARARAPDGIAASLFAMSLPRRLAIALAGSALIWSALLVGLS